MVEVGTSVPVKPVSPTLPTLVVLVCFLRKNEKGEENILLLARLNENIFISFYYIMSSTNPSTTTSASPYSLSGLSSYLSTAIPSTTPSPVSSSVKTQILFLPIPTSRSIDGINLNDHEFKVILKWFFFNDESL